MRATTALLLKELISKLHPPSPITPRESQKLLRLLNTSFQRRLDDLHPSPRLHQEDESPHGRVPLVSSREPDPHLHSVLHHPLLEPNVAKPTENSKLRAAQIFREAVRDTRVSPQLIHSCCRRYLEGVKRSEAVPSDSLLGVKIAAWLSSVSDSTRCEILTNTRLLPDLIYVMYADGKEGEVWDWLSTVYKRMWGDPDARPPDIVDLLDVEDSFVCAMAQAPIRLGALEDAVQQFIQASKYRVQSRRGNVRPNVNDELSYRPLLKSWRRIAAAILFKRRAHGISPSAFNELLGLSIPFTAHPTISKGFMMLYHPEARTSEVLYQELRSEVDRQCWASWCRTSSHAMRKALLLAILDAAELSLTHQRPEESQFFLDLAQAQWPKIFKIAESTQPAKRLECVREELSTQIPLNAFAVT